MAADIRARTFSSGDPTAAGPRSDSHERWREGRRCAPRLRRVQVTSRARSDGRGITRGINAGLRVKVDPTEVLMAWLSSTCVPVLLAVALCALAGGMLAFASNRDGDTEIYAMRPNGSNVRRLTHSRKYDSPASWSPEGRK